MRCALILLLFLALPAGADQPLRIAVAANFKPALQRVSAIYEAQTGRRVLLSSASTGSLYSQIVNGAPYDLFFSADRQTAQRVAGQDPSRETFCYALGRLALVGGNGKLADLANPRFSLAIANPVTAPYGKAALEVLERPDFQPGQARKLVRGNNVAQAYQFWHSGAVDLALVSLSLALESEHATPIPPGWHAPLAQYAVVLARTEPVDAYLKWIRSDTVRSIILDAGYQPCP